MKQRIIAHLARGVPACEAAFDHKSGRFLAANGGWAVTLQDRIYALALLYTAPDSPCHGDERLLNWCRRGGDALRAFQAADGRFEFIKIDGSSWGMTYQPWTIYHWLETYRLLRDELGPARRRRWETGLTLAYDGLNAELAAPRAHNIPTWNGMSLVRGGLLFGRDDWLATGRAQVLFAAANQHPDGYWSEGAGPTNGYNTVYIHALGLYHAFTADRRVLPALRRAASFHAAFIYPDGSSVETVDGRQRYEASGRVVGWPGLTLFPVGRRVIDLWAGRVLDPAAGGVGPYVASAYEHWVEGRRAPLPQEGRERVVYRRQALIRRRGPWQVCVSGYAPPVASRPDLARQRWIMTRANCLSVWHERRGLLVGGGHSKLDPFYATFVVWQDGAMRLEPDRVTFRRNGEWEVARFVYGDVSCRLRFRLRDHRRLDLVFAAPAAAGRQGRVTAGFTLRLHAGEQLVWRAAGKPGITGDVALDPLHATGVNWPRTDTHRTRTLAGEGWELAMPAESAMTYPAYPFNPYAINDAAPPEQALASVSAGFLGAAERAFSLRLA